MKLRHMAHGSLIHITPVEIYFILSTLFLQIFTAKLLRRLGSNVLCRARVPSDNSIFFAPANDFVHIRRVASFILHYIGRRISACH